MAEGTELKGEIYRQNCHLKLMEEVIAKRDWNKKTIDAREKAATLGQKYMVIAQ